LTNRAAGDVILNISGHGRPPVVSLQEVESFEATWVSSGRVIMMKFEEGFTGFGRNIHAIAKVEDAISDTPITEFSP